MKIRDKNKRRLYDAHQKTEDYVVVAKLLRIKQTTAWAIINNFSSCLSRPTDNIEETTVLFRKN